MTTRRHFLQAIPVLPAALGAGSALAQPVLNKPVHLMVAASPGTTIDSVARFVAEPLSSILGMSVVVENRPGAGGALGSAAVARAPADGYTLLMTGVTHFSARYSGEAAATYDPLADFKAVARVCSAALAVVVPTNSPYKTMSDLLGAMKAQPGEINYGSGGVGSTSHLCTVILNDLTRTKAKHVPYRGNTQAVADTVAGIVAFTCQGSGGVIPLIEAGRLRALAVTSAKRWETLSDVPTGIECGIPGFQVASWMGMLAPAKTPDAMVARISDGLAQVARSPEFKTFCDKQSMFVELKEHRDFQASMPEEDARWRRVAELVKQT